jgi:hypothetical protein
MEGAAAASLLLLLQSLTHVHCDHLHDGLCSNSSALVVAIYLSSFQLSLLCFLVTPPVPPHPPLPPLPALDTLDWRLL